jgi:hypothetical protein
MAEVQILQDPVILELLVVQLFLYLARCVLQIMASLQGVGVEVGVAVDLILATGMVVLVAEAVQFLGVPVRVQHGQAQVQAGQVKHQQEHLLPAVQAEEQ